MVLFRLFILFLEAEALNFNSPGVTCFFLGVLFLALCNYSRVLWLVVGLFDDPSANCGMFSGNNSVFLHFISKCTECST